VLATDQQLVELWLHGRSPHTQRAYRADAQRFLRFVAKPLRAVTLGDLQAFADALGGQASSRARTLGSVKSLLSFGQRLGYLPLNIGGALKLPPRKDTLAERILDEPTVQRMLALEPTRRNQVLLRLLYATGARVAELAGLRWRDVVARADGGQVTLFGKGGKTRTVLLPPSVFDQLVALRGTAPLEAPVFPGRRGRPLDVSSIRLIVYAAARRTDLGADLEKEQPKRHVSPHWLRHAHATHALERGAPIHLVQATLGHASVATTGRYTHARPTDSSARYLAV
jgi:integrase/recombinase XerD